MSESADGLLVQPWRKAFEIKAAVVWGGAATYQIMFPLAGAFSLPAAIAALLSFIMCCVCLVDTNKVFWRRALLFESNLLFTPLTSFLNKVDALPSHIYLGEGWEWTGQHTQWVYDLQRKDIMTLAPPKWYTSLLNKTLDGRVFNVTSLEDEREHQEKLIRAVEKKRHKLSADDKKNRVSVEQEEKGKFRGWSWIHGMDKSKSLYFPYNDLKGNTLICGTTRSGKTVLYRVITRQLIRNSDECTIVIDPKGDLDLLNIMMEAARDEGRLDDFVFFHPAYPEKSHRIDPFANYQQPSQLASRIEPLIPSSGPNGDSFSKFAWGVMESILSGMDMVNVRPSLMSLRGIIEKGPDDLLFECIVKHCENLKINGYRAQIKAFEKSVPKNSKGPDSPIKVQAAAAYYKEVVKGVKASPAIDGVLGFYEHNREHASKMLASLMPVLKSLTTGPLAGLLSPDSDDSSDARPITSFDSMIRQKKICYIGLDAMADPAIATAIGSIFLSDLVACAASRYTHGGSGDHVVNLLVDEASNIVNQPYIELLNKSAGANFRNFAATQTIPDFEAALGVASLKDKTLGNFNNMISLRVIDTQTREFVSEQMGEGSVRTAQITQSTSTMGSGDNPLLYNGTYGARTTDADAPMIDPAIMGKIPDLEFIGVVSAGRIIKGRIPLLVAEFDSTEDGAYLVDSLPWIVAAKQEARFNV